ncbi:MAG: hypothetical protein V8Q57_08490 [Blautia sp.]
MPHTTEAKAGQTENSGRKKTTAAASTKIVPKKLIIIMNESLSDFEEFDNFKSSEEILPTIHSLKENKEGLSLCAGFWWWYSKYRV